MSTLTPEQIEHYKREEQSRRAYAAWMHRTAKGMPALAARVFALREVAYMGYGFHWSMERRLGNVIAAVNDYEGDIWRGIEAVANRIITEILVEEIYRDVAKAERSSKSTMARLGRTADQ